MSMIVGTTASRPIASVSTFMRRAVAGHRATSNLAKRKPSVANSLAILANVGARWLLLAS